MDAVLARGEPITIAYDLRECSLPSRKQIGVALKWIGANSELLDRHLQGIAIVLSSIMVRSIVGFVLGLTQPPQPHGVFADETAAFEFARDRCTEVRQWKGRGRLKQEFKQELVSSGGAGAPAPTAEASMAGLDA